VAQENKPPTEADKADALKHAGQMGDAGVKAGLVVVGGEAAVAGAVVAAPAVGAATTSAYVQTTAAVSAAGTAINNAYAAGQRFVLNAAYTVETLKSGGGGIQAIADFARALTPGAGTPQNKAGRAGAAVKIALKVLGIM
jgi:hypothetical protein